MWMSEIAFCARNQTFRLRPSQDIHVGQTSEASNQAFASAHKEIMGLLKEQRERGAKLRRLSNPL
jgi:hypothetical protein